MIQSGLRYRHILHAVLNNQRKSKRHRFNTIRSAEKSIEDMNGLHYIICSWENTSDVAQNRCVCLETIARVPTASCLPWDVSCLLKSLILPFNASVFLHFQLQDALIATVRITEHSFKRSVLYPKVLRFSIDPDLTWIQQACGGEKKQQPGLDVQVYL